MRRRDDALAFLAKRRITDWSVPFIAASRGVFAFRPKLEYCWIKRVASAPVSIAKNRIDLKVGELAEIGAEVRRVERMPELLHDLATAFGEHLGEPAALLVAEGVVLADGCDLLVTLLQRPIAERMGEFTGAVPATRITFLIRWRWVRSSAAMIGMKYGVPVPLT